MCAHHRKTGDMPTLRGTAQLTFTRLADRGAQPRPHIHGGHIRGDTAPPTHRGAQPRPHIHGGHIGGHSSAHT